MQSDKEISLQLIMEKIIMKFNRLLFLVLLVFFFSSAMANKAHMFDDVDQDGDGYISKSEAKNLTEMQSNWSDADTDKDGKIDVSEFGAFEGKDMFQPADVEEPEPGAAPTK
jgi:hypothetical protein